MLMHQFIQMYKISLEVSSVWMYLTLKLIEVEDKGNIATSSSS